MRCVFFGTGTEFVNILLKSMLQRVNGAKNIFQSSHMNYRILIFTYIAHT
jgi:hypothetical protein